MQKIFGNKFSPKKTPIRKASPALVTNDYSPKHIERELGPDIGPIRIQLGDQEMIFDGGNWIPESGKVSSAYKENEKLKKELNKLEEENHLLKLKLELLIDMLTESSAETQLQKEDMKSLKSLKKRSGT